MADNEFRIESDSPANKELMFWRIVGHEALARPSAYELTVLSKNRTLDAKDILGHAFDVVIEFQDADGGTHQRHCQGHAVRFVRVGNVGRHFEYRIMLRSWFWLLTKRINSRILQEKPVLEVMDAVFENSPIKRFKKTKADNVIGTHNARRYCVQHQESDYQFISRLLEDEGIYYWFDAHDAPGTMHLSDASDMAHEKLPVEDTLRHAGSDANEARFNEISRWVSARQFHTGKQDSRDSDFKAIKKKLGAAIDVAAEHELADLEMFEFPGGYFTGDDAENRAKLRGDELNARRDRHWALTRWPDVAAGRSFKFEGDPDGARDGDYIIAACTFVASHPGYEGVTARTAEQPVYTALSGALSDDAVNADTLQALEELIAGTPALNAAPPGTSAFLLTAIPADRPFRAPRLTPRVTMPGPQTAIVVGPEGEEIYADKHGRVKVHFHWDRYNEGDENSTCWVRVAQPWAGKGWGGYFIPRIGQEVIVDFLNGDPDRPVIVGRVYNDDQPIPFDSHTQSGFRTRSTPKGGVDNFNEFRFDDQKGSEQVFLHAEKNQDIEVENDETHWVGHDRKKTIDNDENVEVKNNRTEKVGVDEKIDIGANRTETVGANEDITIASNRTETVGASETVTIGADRNHTVGANETRTVGASESTSIGASRTDSVGASMTQTIGAGLTQTVGAAINITSGGPTTFIAAGGFTIIAPGGTKVIDNELCQVGGTIKEGYASKLDFNGMVTEFNGVKIEGTISTNAMIGFKFEKVGMDIVEHMAAVHQRQMDMLDAGIDIDFVTGKMIL